MLYYDQLERNEDVYKTLLDDSKNEGLQKGIKQGKAEGLAEGLAEGEAKGKAESTRVIVLNMHRKGMDNKAIAEFTGIDMKEIISILSSQ